MKKKTKEKINEIFLSSSYYISIACIFLGIFFAIFAYYIDVTKPENAGFNYFTIFSYLITLAIGFISLGIALGSAYKFIFTDRKIILIQRSLFQQNLNFLEETRQWFNANLYNVETLSWKTLKGIQIAHELNREMRKKSVIPIDYQDELWKYFKTTIDMVFKKGNTWSSIRQQQGNFIRAYTYLDLYFYKEPQTINEFNELMEDNLDDDEINDFEQRKNDFILELQNQ